MVEEERARLRATPVPVLTILGAQFFVNLIMSALGTVILITVGRISENSLQIEDISVSSRHAQLTLGRTGTDAVRAPYLSPFKMPAESKVLTGLKTKGFLQLFRHL